MRDLFLTAAIMGLVPVALLQPHVGVLVYQWVSLMNPHRMVWGFGYDFPYAEVLALTAMVGWALSREPKRLPVTTVTVLLMLLWVWVSITTWFALSPDRAIAKWELFSKILLMTFVTMGLITNWVRLHALVWVVVVSLGFYGIKGGLFAIATGGRWSVVGPTDSFIHDNNAIALAMVMVLPLIWYLRQHAAHRWVRWCLLAAVLLTVGAIVATYSRGGLLGLGAVATVLLLRTRHRVAFGAVAIVLTIAAVQFLPEKWFGRMSTIETYEEDESAQGRLDMWRMAAEIAAARPLVGGGYRVFHDPSVYPRFNPNADKVRDVHSIFFEMLGEHGYPGLILFVALGLATVMAAQRVRRLSRRRDDLLWAYDLAGMLQASLAAYAACGAFLTLATFDLAYVLIALTVALRAIVGEAIRTAPAVRGAARPAIRQPAVGPAAVAGGPRE